VIFLAKFFKNQPSGIIRKKLEEQEKSIFRKMEILPPENISKKSPNPFQAQKRNAKRQLNPDSWAENPNGFPWM
jgi:hypothetical protein